MVPQTIKSLVQRSANRLGYRIDKLVERAVVPPIDVFDLLVTRFASDTPDFFFIQVGANDGVTDDPIRHYVRRYHWRGILVEPQPAAFAKLIENYRDEPQLIFENAAIADADGTARLYVADGAPSDNDLSVFSSLHRDAVERALSWRDMPLSAERRIRAVDVRARSLQSLVDQHQIRHVDLLQSDVQGYDCEVIRQLLNCGLKPRIIHFEHIHARPDDLRECYSRLAHEGYLFSEMANDTVASLSPSNKTVQ